MSKRRAKHHISRRRAYSTRRRDLRERLQRVDETERYLPGNSMAAIHIEIEEENDFEAPAPWSIRLRDRASAA